MLWIPLFRGADDAIFCDYLFVLEDKKFREKDFHKLLDLYPYIFRPGIFEILKYLKNKKSKNKNLKVIIYSNNMGTPRWANMIKRYIENKIGGMNIFAVSTIINCMRTVQQEADWINPNIELTENIVYRETLQSNL